MWLELIQKYVSDNDYVSPQKGAAMADIKSAEKKLNISFPLELVSLLLEVNGDKWLLLSAQDIVQYNLDGRKNYADCYKDIDKLLFIGQNGCGDYYSYPIQDGKISTDELVRWEHETNECIPVAKGLIDLIEKYYTDQI